MLCIPFLIHKFWIIAKTLLIPPGSQDPKENFIVLPTTRMQIVWFVISELVCQPNRTSERLLDRFDRDLLARVEQRRPLLQGQVPRVARRLDHRFARRCRFFLAA